tara:strand:+ start:133 stop:1026 length:894 start_codon:yes stop_codon:yes gene_type:complete
MQVIEKAFAKVNISLNLTGQKDHNLHYLVSMICFCDFYDTIVIEDSEEFKYVINDDVKFNKPDLILKTIKFLSKEIDRDLPPFKITLNKQIPIGAGLGGGSANSAATLRAIDKFFNLNLSYDQKLLIGNKIGSDVPSCILSKPLILSGYGDQIRQLEGLSDKNIIIIYPNISVSTKEVFDNVDINLIEKKDSQRLEKQIEDNIGFYNDGTNFDKLFSNDLQSLVLKKYPVIKDVKDCLTKLGSSFVSMTGSGSAFFGFFEESSIDQAYKKINNLNKDWMIIKCKLMGSNNREINKLH